MGAKKSDLFVRRQRADQRRRQSHHDDRDEKRVLAAHEVADAAEHQRPERTDREAHAEQREAGQKARRLIARREEQLPEKHGQRPVNVEIVPLEHGAERRREDDQTMATVQRTGSGSRRHEGRGRASHETQSSAVRKPDAPKDGAKRRIFGIA